MKLLTLASTPRFAEAHKGYFQRQEVCLAPYEDKAQLDSHDVLVVFIPIKCQGQFVSPVEIWRQYLARHQPATRLIIAGVEAISHQNYLDLLALPKDFYVFFHNLKAVSNAEWQPLKTEAMDMRDKLHRFYEGHGKESVTYTLSKIRRKMETLDKRLKQVNYQEAWKEIFEPLEGQTVAYTEEKWKELIRRWEHYAPFFKYLPFNEEMEEVGRRMQHISPFFEGNCQDEALYSDCKSKKNIDRIFDILDSIKTEYVP